MSSSETPADNGHDDRLDRLESRLTFLEHTVDVLAGELEAQQGHTHRLQKTLEGLREQLGSLQRDTGISDSPDEPPPHY